MTICQQVLSSWREAERLLDTLPPLSSDEEAVRLVILTMREMYQRLTRDPRRPRDADSDRATLERAQAIIAEVRARTAAAPDAAAGAFTLETG